MHIKRLVLLRWVENRNCVRLVFGHPPTNIIAMITQGFFKKMGEEGWGDIDFSNKSRQELHSTLLPAQLKLFTRIQNKIEISNQFNHWKCWVVRVCSSHEYSMQCLG